MMLTRLVVPIAVFALLSSIVIGQESCRFTDAKGVIDLTSLGTTDGTPAYRDKVPPGSNYKYSYNPCKPFNEGSNCLGVAACQISLDGLYSFSLGAQSSVRLDPGGAIGGVASLTYNAGEKIAKIELVCPKTEVNEFEALGEDPTNSYKFRLTHKCACWDGCKGPQPTTPSSPGGGDNGVGGIVFIVLLLSLLAIYFVGFGLFYRIRQEKRGADLIAHRTFWIALPGYARDGVVYVFRRIANKGADPYGAV